MTELRELLADGQCRGAVRLADGTVTRLLRGGVADLFDLVTQATDTLRNATLADSVVGRGAALLAVKGGITRVHANIISREALNVLTQAGVTTTYDQLVPHIINRRGTDICPVEKLTADTSDPDEALRRIARFLNDTH